MGSKRCFLASYWVALVEEELVSQSLIGEDLESLLIEGGFQSLVVIGQDCEIHDETDH